jgi:hypothetical protein
MFESAVCDGRFFELEKSRLQSSQRQTIGFLLVGSFASPNRKTYKDEQTPNGGEISFHVMIFL